MENRALKQQVRRNSMKFPEHFMFELTENEIDNMVSQNVIPSKQVLGGALPFAFTEHGVLMLANVLKSERAIAMSIKLIEVFVKLREVVNSQKNILLKLEQLENKTLKNNKDIKVLFEAVKQLIQEPTKERTKIGYIK
ncbi:MAG: ORF6N domain-containing protein [Chitinophagales bacterium]|nr:ORF6N domain-containing protein [Chitinophagales bacterium]